MIEKQTIFESGQITFLKKLMLCFSISVLINISLFPTVQRCIIAADEFHWKIDSSVVELIMASLLDIGDNDADLPDSGDDTYSSVDFLCLGDQWHAINSFLQENKKVVSVSSFPDNPTLEKFTPPPQI